MNTDYSKIIDKYSNSKVIKRNVSFATKLKHKRNKTQSRRRIPDADYRHLKSLCLDENGVFRSSAPITQNMFEAAKGMYEYQNYSADKKLTSRQSKYWCDIWFDHFQGG